MSNLAVVESCHEQEQEQEQEVERWDIQLLRERSTEEGERWKISRQDWNE